MTGEEIGKVAGGVVDGLKAQPALLVIVVLNVVMIAVQAWSGSATTAERGALIASLIQQCKPAH